MKHLTRALKDRVVFLGWIAGLVLALSLIWSFTFPFRSMCLMRSTNKTLILMDDTRRLTSPLLRHSAVPGPLGCWYTLSNSDSIFFVFAIMKEGILVPCGAEIADNGKVKEIIPLGSHAQQVIDQIPQGLMQVYVRRIESSAAAAAAVMGGI